MAEPEIVPPPPRPREKAAPGGRPVSGTPPQQARVREEQQGSAALPPRSPPPPEARAREEQPPARSRPVELIVRAKEQLRALTGYGVDSVSGFAKADGGWHLSVTVVELHRIPAATDVLASYEVDLDHGGDIVSYHRGRRYFRDQVGEEG